MSGPAPNTPPEQMDTPVPESRPGNAGLDWLDDDGHDEPEWTPPPRIPTPIVAPSAETRNGEPEESPAASGRGRMLPAGVLAVAAILALGYLALWPDPEPRSPALEAEQSAPPVERQDRPNPTPEPPPVAEPLPIESTAAPVAPEAPEPSGQVETAPVELPPDPPPTSQAAPGRPAPMAEPPASEPPRPEPATAEALVRIAQTLETQRAMIERLERGNQVLSDRLAGLEVHGETAQAPSAPPPRARKRPASELPPSTTQPQARLTQRRGRDDAPPLPFYIESVDNWNGEPRVVVRADGRLIDLKPGDSHGDWRIKSAQGQAVTLLSSDGRERTVTAGGP